MLVEVDVDRLEKLQSVSSWTVQAEHSYFVVEVDVLMYGMVKLVLDVR